MQATKAVDPPSARTTGHATTRATVAPKPAPKPGTAARTLKRCLIAGGVATYLGLAGVGMLFGASAVYIGMHKQLPNALTMETFGELWHSTAGDAKERRKLKLALAPPGMLFFLLIPIAIAAAGARKRELHGSARWANTGEVQQAGLLSNRSGIVVGKVGGRFMTLQGQQSVMLSAPTRSGKGVGIVIPNLLAWTDSVVVVDIKGENYKRTAGYRARYGQAVYLWAPFAPNARTHAWNPLSAVRIDRQHTVGDILAIGQVLYPQAHHSSGSENFFAEQARNLFLGMVLYLVETPELRRTIGELLRQASGKGRPLKDHLQAVISHRARHGPNLSEGCVDALGRFLGTSENTLTSILATFNSPLTVFTEPLVDAATSGDAFSLHDLRRRRMSVYVVVPPNRLADAAVLLNLFFSQAINLNTTVLPEEDASLRHQCLFVLDEFTAMGRVGILAKAVGYLAGYNLRLLTVIQSMSQLDSVYGKDDARTFVTNHALQILYAPREQRDANEYSEMLGTLTEKSETEGRSVSVGGKGGSSRSSNKSPQRRLLLLPQEFKELGLAKQVVILENCKPILAEKIFYYSDSVLSSRHYAVPEVAVLNLNNHTAQIEGRVRDVLAGEIFSVDDIAGAFGKSGDLPDLSGEFNPEGAAAFSRGYLHSGAVAITKSVNSSSSAAPAPGHEAQGRRSQSGNASLQTAAR